MLKRLFEKWRLWEEAALGSDDLHGDYLAGLEKRVTRLETAVSKIREVSPEDIPPEDGRA